MDNKGFGLLALLAFIVLIGIVLYAAFVFINRYINFDIFSKSSIPNYKNEYIIYMKEHNITFNDKK